MKLHKKSILLILVAFGILVPFSAITISIVLREIGSPSEISRSIEINGNSGWFNAKNEGIATGSGTYSDPYVIEDLVMIDSEAPNDIYIGIYIRNSDVHFKIENCTISNFHWGINLYNVSNARLINNNCSLNRNGIYISNSYNTTIHGNIANDNTYTYWGIFYRGHGITVEESNDITLSENTANNNAYGIGLYSNNHTTVSGNIMNKCGLRLYLDDSIEELNSDDLDDIIEGLNSLDIDNTNLVNGKPLYYYTNEKNLGSNNFTNGGQVLLVNCSDSHILNLNVSYSTMGITLYFANNINISGNTANNNDNGITLEISNNTIISGNTANNNENYGISLGYSNNATISGNNVNNNSNGISLSNIYNNIVLGNTINNNDWLGINVDGINNNISGNEIQGNDLIFRGNNNSILGNSINNGGIFISGSNHVTFSGNIMNKCGLSIDGPIEELSSHNIDDTNLVNNKSLYYYVNENFLTPTDFSNAGQVFLINCRNSQISNLNISYVPTGISVYFSTFIDISRNTVNLNGDGIHLFECFNCEITENNVNNNHIGIRLENCENNELTENIADKNIIGIKLYSCGFNILSRNNITNNLDDGISLDWGYENIISNNEVNNNHECGIFLTGDNNGISGNIINNNAYGIYLSHSNNNTISGNILIGNDECIIEEYSHENLFSDNGVCSIVQDDRIVLGYNIFILLGILVVGIMIVGKKDKL